VGTLIIAAQEGYWHPAQPVLEKLATDWLQLTGAYGEKCTWYNENIGITDLAKNFLKKSTPLVPKTEEETRRAPAESIKVKSPDEVLKREAPASQTKKSQGPAGGEKKMKKEKTPEKKAYEVKVTQSGELVKISPLLLPIVGIAILIAAGIAKFLNKRMKRNY